MPHVLQVCLLPLSPILFVISKPYGSVSRRGDGKGLECRIIQPYVESKDLSALVIPEGVEVIEPLISSRANAKEMQMEPGELILCCPW